MVVLNYPSWGGSWRRKPSLSDCLSSWDPPQRVLLMAVLPVHKLLVSFPTTRVCSNINLAPIRYVAKIAQYPQFNN